MRHRTNSEIKAYVDGYTACFNQYSECLKNRKSVLDSKKKMEIYLAAVTGVLEATGNATNADRIRAMADEELATFLYNFGDCPCFGVKFCERGTRCEDAVLMKLRDPVDNGACFNGETSEKVQE